MSSESLAFLLHSVPVERVGAATQVSSSDGFFNSHRGLDSLPVDTASQTDAVHEIVSSAATQVELYATDAATQAHTPDDCVSAATQVELHATDAAAQAHAPDDCVSAATQVELHATDAAAQAHAPDACVMTQTSSGGEPSVQPADAENQLAACRSLPGPLRAQWQSCDTWFPPRAAPAAEEAPISPVFQPVKKRGGLLAALKQKGGGNAAAGVAAALDGFTEDEDAPAAAEEAPIPPVVPVSYTHLTLPTKA